MSSALDEPAERATFEIVDTRDVILVIEAQSVAHQHKMHLLVVFHSNSVHTIDATYDRVGVLLEVLVQFWQYLLDQRQLLLHHRLDNEASIVAEEEEASAGARSLARLKDLVTIRARVQASIDDIKVDLIYGPHPLEYTGSIGCYRGT